MSKVVGFMTDPRVQPHWNVEQRFSSDEGEMHVVIKADGSPLAWEFPWIHRPEWVEEGDLVWCAVCKVGGKAITDEPKTCPHCGGAL